MNKSFFMDIAIPLYDLVHVCEGFRLSKPFFDFRTQVSLTQFCDDISIVLGGINLVQSEHMRNIFH